MKQRFKHPYILELFPDEGEVNNEPSLTVPDQSLTVSEILARFARGLPVTASQVSPLFEDTEGLPDPRSLDLVDRAELAEQYAAELKAFAKSNQGRAEAEAVSAAPSPAPAAAAEQSGAAAAGQTDEQPKPR